MKAVIQLKSPITRQFQAHDWLDHRNSKTKNPQGKGLSNSVPGSGQDYFTSRSPGSVTAHGYARTNLLKFQLTHHLSGIESIRVFIDDYCQQQHQRNRKILGLRFRISLDSKELWKRVHDRVDVDQMFARGVEHAFKHFTREVYPRDEIGFIMAIHCYAKPSRRLGEATSGATQTNLPGLHAHLFVFPETKKGRQVNFHDQTVLSWAGQPLNLLHELWINCQGAIATYDHARQPRPKPAVGQGLRFISREAMLSAVEDSNKLPEIPRDKRHQFRIDSAQSWLENLEPYLLLDRFQDRKKQVEDLRAGTERPQLLQNLLHYLKVMEGFAPTFKYERDDILALCLAEEPHLVEPKHVEFFDINGLRPILVQKPQVTPDRSPDIRRTLQKLQLHRQAGRLLIESQKALADLHIAALTEGSLPDWVKYLDEITRSSKLPHQHFLDLRRDSVETPVEEYSIPAKSIDRPKS